jgi:hypothetical protein
VDKPFRAFNIPGVPPASCDQSMLIISLPSTPRSASQLALELNGKDLLQRQDLELNRLIEAQNNRLAICLMSASNLPGETQDVFLSSLFPPIYIFSFL